MNSPYGGYFNQKPTEILQRQVRQEAQEAADRIVSAGLMKVRRVEVTIYYTDGTHNHVQSVAPGVTD